MFISHAWKYTFTSVVNALRNHFQDKPDIFIWFDLFSNNQIEAPNLDFDWWSGTFQNAIEDFGHVVMVISPWKNPIPFARAWCLFEVYVTKVTNSVFEVAMSAEEKADFIKTIKKDGDEYLEMLGNINVKKSECFKEEDRKAIFDLVDTLPNKANTINAEVTKLMREWCLGVLKDVDENASPRDVVEQKSSYASMLEKQAEYAEALAVYTEVLGLYTALDGDESATVAEAYDGMGTVYRNQGDYPQALQYHQMCLDIRLDKLGTDHPSVATTYGSMGLVYDSQGDYPQALQYYKMCLDIRLDKLGTDHPRVTGIYNNMGNVYNSQGDYPQALQYLQMCLDIRLDKLGTDHPDTKDVQKTIEIVKGMMN